VAYPHVDLWISPRTVTAILDVTVRCDVLVVAVRHYAPALRVARPTPHAAARRAAVIANRSRVVANRSRIGWKDRTSGVEASALIET